MPHMVNLLDAGSLLSAYGWIGIGVVLFAETGLLIGFFLPGDTLLFTAGLLCTSAGASAHTKLSLPLVLLAAILGALAGAQTGHFLGSRGGRALLARSRNKHLHKGLARAEEILGRYGHAKAIVIARFIPVVRTVLNPLAGAVGVPTRTFALWQVIGGTAWSGGLVIGGYLLGSSIPNVDKYLLPLVALIFLVSVTPVALEILRSRKTGKPIPADPHASPASPAAPYAVPPQPHYQHTPQPQYTGQPTTHPQYGGQAPAQPQYGGQSAAQPHYGAQNAARTQYGQADAVPPQYGLGNAAGPGYGAQAAGQEYGLPQVAAPHYGPQQAAQPQQGMGAEYGSQQGARPEYGQQAPGRMADGQWYDGQGY